MTHAETAQAVIADEVVTETIYAARSKQSLL